MLLHEYIDPAVLNEDISAGYVSEQFHPEKPYRILNYTDPAIFDRHWTEATTRCRGLIHDTRTGRILARPFQKFFNWGEPGAPEPAPGEPVTVHDKLDGSLGILYPDRAIATRGSFMSPQARRGTDLLRTLHPDFQPEPGRTYLFEIIYPENRIVCDYGGTADLFLLGAIDIDTGEFHKPGALTAWNGPRAKRFPYGSFTEALAAEPRPGAEGLVIRLSATGAMLKVKQDDYKALHAIVTNTSARRLYTMMSAHACADCVSKDTDWGSFLGYAAEEAHRALALGPDWQRKFLEGVPEEFAEWVDKTMARIRNDAEANEARALAALERARRAPDNRSAFAEVADDPLQKEIMGMLRNDVGIARLRMKSWRLVFPDDERPFAQKEEAA